MADKGILFSGLPESGKTTFLAALWYFIFNSTKEHEYTYDSLENTELEYLNSISLNWAGCEDVIRTNQNKIEMVSIKMVHNTSGNSMTLTIPDISGETFNTQFQDREWDEEFDYLLENVYGIILFIDPRDKKNKPRLIYHESQHFRIFDEMMVNEYSEQSWTENLVPSQVKLVDFLQMVDFHKPNFIKKISVIISCWDLIDSNSKPELWCKQELPLLHQYLNSNEQLFKVKYFGVSSQGGSYESEHIKENLINKEPLDRIIVTDGLNTSNNILDPILWITNEDKD